MILNPYTGSTHQRLLASAAVRTTGAIMELGTGFFSTPMLHAIVKAQGRLLMSFDNNLEWLTSFEKFRSPFHIVQYIDNWTLLPKTPAGLVFIDQNPSEARLTCLKELRATTDVFCIHDVENAAYEELNRELATFPYQVRDVVGPDTALVSDRLDVTSWL